MINAFIIFCSLVYFLNGVTTIVQYHKIKKRSDKVRTLL